MLLGLSEHIHNDGVWRFFGNCGDEKRVSALDSYFESNPLPAINLYFSHLKDALLSTITSLSYAAFYALTVQ